MRFAFDADQRLFADTVRDFLAAECSAGDVRAAWQPGGTGRDLGRWRQLAAMGVVGLLVPEAHGGLGMDEVGLVRVLEETGRVALPEPIVECAAVAVPLLVDTDATSHLPGVAAGDVIVTVGLAGAAGGERPYVADAHLAGLLLLEHVDAIHAVPREQVELTAQPSVDGARRLWSVAWEPAPATRIAVGATAAVAAAAAFDRGALAASAQLLGVAQQLIDLTVDYARERHQFGQPIGSFQAVKHHVADALLALELARPVVYRAAWSVARAAPDRSLHVSMAKAYASDAADEAARTALQVHGAIGYTWECDLHLWMKRAWALAAAWGSAAWHRGRVAEAVIGRG